MIFNSKDLLINVNKLPDAESEEFNAFWRNERKKCKEGIYIDNVFINPFLYWHCNLWTIISDHITKGRTRQKPDFRDSEWLLTNKIWEAETWKNEEGLIRRKGVVAAGTRRFSKSVLEASFCAWKAVIWKNSQVVISGGNEADIKIVTDMLDLGINELPDYFMKSKVEDNWKKQVTLGFKDKNTNERNVWSTFAIRNFDNGNNEEALAGLTPTGGIIDEGGKYKFLKALLAGLPGLTTPNGWRGSFLVCGTGGDMDNFQDFQTLFDDPESYNFLSCYLPDEDKKCGIFLPGWMSYTYPKKETNLSAHLNLDEKEHPNLSKVKIQVANKEINEALIDQDRALAAKSNDSSALLKATMYFPKNTREIFLTDSHNNFPIEACKAQQDFLKLNYEPIYVELYRNDKNEVKWKTSSLKPISKYPVNPSDDKKAPVVIYEFPIAGSEEGTYVMGVDSYNQSESSDRINSLGSIYVIKRTADPLGQYQDCMVASYAGRPANITDFYKIAYDLAEFYGCYILPEHNQSFEDYFINRKKGSMLWDTPKIAVEIRWQSNPANKKGLAPTSPNQRFGMDLFVRYAIDEMMVSDEKEGEKVALGVCRILDPMLLEEMIQYRSQPSSSKGIHAINCDRIVAFYHGLILCNHFNKFLPVKNNPTAIKEAQKHSQTPIYKDVLGGVITKKGQNQFKGFSKKPFRGAKFV